MDAGTSEFVKEQKETNALLREMLNSQSGVTHIYAQSTVDLHTGSQPYALPSKQTLAEEFLRQNPGYLQYSGRQLESEIKPMSVAISYRTWNDAKKTVLAEK